VKIIVIGVSKSLYNGVYSQTIVWYVSGIDDYLSFFLNQNFFIKNPIIAQDEQRSVKQEVQTKDAVYRRHTRKQNTNKNTLTNNTHKDNVHQNNQPHLKMTPILTGHWKTTSITILAAVLSLEKGWCGSVSMIISF